jgi:DNA-binding transcriptional ArsR family regulator
LSERLGVPPTSLSFHLKELVSAALVTQERHGRHLICRAAYDQMNNLLSYLTEHCCQGSSCAVSLNQDTCCPGTPASPTTHHPR